MGSRRRASLALVMFRRAASVLAIVRLEPRALMYARASSEIGSVMAASISKPLPKNLKYFSWIH